MYFATLLKTTAPVKLPISQLSQIIKHSLEILFLKVNTNPTLILRFPSIILPRNYLYKVKLKKKYLINDIPIHY